MHIEALGKIPPNKQFEKIGEPVHIYDVREFVYVRPPKYQDKYCAFGFMILVDKDWRIFFDFEPLKSGYVPPKDIDHDWKFGKGIADAYNDRLHEMLLKSYPKQIEALDKIGLWMEPSLVPYPMSLILKKLSNNDQAGATSVLISHCNTEF
ncbi:MAG TPA: hypothetical protein VE573_05005 [Nitrososphaeraceae archaeon]|jgi:hypothetical protein|nr:hypothetical protein [Nitrososphaeraceae archaeon]